MTPSLDSTSKGWLVCRCYPGVLSAPGLGRLSIRQSSVDVVNDARQSVDIVGDIMRARCAQDVVGALQVAIVQLGVVALQILQLGHGHAHSQRHNTTAHTSDADATRRRQSSVSQRLDDCESRIYSRDAGPGRACDVVCVCVCSDCSFLIWPAPPTSIRP